ncbi:Glutelin type-B 2 [Rhynchospora pubera]|uniref:Glutelin type-B 2 n=1 Tax=Rhynchospora pubera TaxID=906938 RepID=A0AAV8EQN4_9POAL|nr:Glutelin type-B 2 [Rhynchospora pubera]
MATLSPLSYSLCIMVLFHGCVAQFFSGQSQWQSSRGFRAGQRACRFDNLAALEPSRNVESQAGRTEFFEQTEQLRCAGVSALRRIIEPRGLLLPTFSNAPSLFYVVQGRGLTGFTFPGCPETYQSFQQAEQFQQEGEVQLQRTRDEHQKIHRFREGDIVAVPAGVSHWCYNDGYMSLVLVHVFDTSNNANQLEPRRRNAVLTPYWNINAHSLMYVTGGQGRVQIVDHQGKTVFDGQLRQKQLLLVPQNYVVLKKADPQQSFEWVSFKTNQNAMVNRLVGKASTIRALSLDVLRASYRITIEQAWRLKSSRREEFAIFTPRFEQQREQFDPEYQRNADNASDAYFIKGSD